MKSVVLPTDGCFPPTIRPASLRDRRDDELVGWLTESGPIWKDILRRHGAILFRGFELRGAEGLDGIIQAVSAKPLRYVGGNSPRTRVSGKVYTSTEYPAEEIITLHNELSYAREWPMKIVFYCDTPPAIGGETVLLDSRAALSLLPSELTEEFDEKGLIYLQTLHDGFGLGRSWQSTFETDQRQVVNEFLTEQGVEFEWGVGNVLKVRYRRDALTLHPHTGERIWFNQADQWHPSTMSHETRKALSLLLKPDDFPHNVYFGDGTAIQNRHIAEIRRILWQQSIAFRWEQHDVLLLDNMLMAHGRRAFKGPRKVYVAMG